MTESTKKQFNDFARRWLYKFTDKEMVDYRELVIDKYSPEDFKLVCEYIRADKTQRRFPLPIDFDRAAATVLKVDTYVDEYPDVPAEQKTAFFKHLKECIKPLTKAWGVK